MRYLPSALLLFTLTAAGACATASNLDGNDTSAGSGPLPTIVGVGGSVAGMASTSTTGGMATAAAGMGNAVAGMATAQAGMPAATAGMPGAAGMMAAMAGMGGMPNNPFLNMGGTPGAAGMATGGMANMGGTDTGGNSAMGGTASGGMASGGTMAMAGMPPVGYDAGASTGSIIIKVNRTCTGCGYVVLEGADLSWSGTSAATAEVFDIFEEGATAFKLRASTGYFVHKGTGGVLSADANFDTATLFEIDAACNTGTNCSTTGTCVGLREFNVANTYVAAEQTDGIRTLEAHKNACAGSTTSWENLDLIDL